jgi:hypothetical protein
MHVNQLFSNRMTEAEASTLAELLEKVYAGD